MPKRGRGRPRRVIERDAILAALREADGSVRAASLKTGIPRTTLTDYLEREPPPKPAPLAPIPPPTKVAPWTRAEVRSMLDQCADALLDECSDFARQLIKTDFLLEVDTALRRLQKRAREGRQRNVSAATARKELVAACEVLNVDPPKRGRKFGATAYNSARQAYRAFARSYHPDQRGGHESMRPQYEAVVDAWSTIENYQREHPE